MRLMTLSVVLVVAGALAGPAVSAEPDSEKITELKLVNLLQQALAEEFTPGREIIVSLVEIPPHTTLERHWHPGEEFHYYLEGEVEIVIDGRDPIVGKPGTVGHIPYKATHTAITKDKAAKALVFRVHTQDEPVRYLENGGAQDQ